MESAKQNAYAVSENNSAVESVVRTPLQADRSKVRKPNQSPHTHTLAKPSATELSRFAGANSKHGNGVLHNSSPPWCVNTALQPGGI